MREFVFIVSIVKANLYSNPVALVNINRLDRLNKIALTMNEIFGRDSWLYGLVLAHSESSGKQNNFC